MKELPNVVILILGDWSHDGNGLSSVVTIHSNFTKREIERAYRKGVKEIEFDLIEDVASGHEDCEIEPEYVHALKEFGYNVNNLECLNNRYYIYEDEFVNIYLFLAELGDSALEWKRVSHTENHIRIGGYGLYSR